MGMQRKAKRTVKDSIRIVKFFFIFNMILLVYNDRHLFKGKYSISLKVFNSRSRLILFTIFNIFPLTEIFCAGSAFYFTEIIPASPKF